MSLTKGVIVLTYYQSNIKPASFFFADTPELRPSGSAIFWSLACSLLKNPEVLALSWKSG